MRGAVATTDDDDDDDEVASSLDRGSIGTLNQIDKLMRKASKETPTPPADETGSTLEEILAIAQSQQPDECNGAAVCVDDDTADSEGINYLIFYKVLNKYYLLSGPYGPFLANKLTINIAFQIKCPLSNSQVETSWE